MKILVLMLSAVIYVISVTEGAPTNTCLLQCMKDVLKCKREENLGITSEIECCDKYTLCYFMCQPDAESAPPCGSAKGKRGRWNKRGKLNKSFLLEDSNEVDSQFY